MVNFLLYRAWLVKERLRKMPRGRKWGAAWLVSITLAVLVLLPWEAIGIITIIVGFVSFAVTTVWAIMSLFDP